MRATPKKQFGRPKLPAEDGLTGVIRARVTQEDEAKFKRLGGPIWVRAALKRARER